jgi:hypothetical protein
VPAQPKRVTVEIDEDADAALARKLQEEFDAEERREAERKRKDEEYAKQLSKNKTVKQDHDPFDFDAFVVEEYPL